MLHVDFKNLSPQVICHPDYIELAPKILEALKDYNLEKHFLLFSSGTTGGALKGYALSHSALFANAKATNDRFELNSEDVWGLSLPAYHVGGLSVLARAHQLGCKVVDLRKWEPQTWIKSLEGVTITTIVPTQLYDLVNLKLTPPKSLKYIIVGGDFLAASLKSKAMELGWPVIRTFGMSEVSSQLACTDTPESDELKILPIHQVKISEDQTLLVKSEALFTLEFKWDKNLSVTLVQDLCDEDGFYITKDRAQVSGDILKHLGRLGDEVKISGHLVNFFQLREELTNFQIKNNLLGSFEFTLEDDPRKGKKLILLSLPNLESHLEQIRVLINPVRIDEVRVQAEFNRTALGKLKRST